MASREEVLAELNRLAELKARIGVGTPAVRGDPGGAGRDSPFDIELQAVLDKFGGFAGIQRTLAGPSAPQIQPVVQPEPRAQQGPGARTPVRPVPPAPQPAQVPTTLAALTPTQQQSENIAREVRKTALTLAGVKPEDIERLGITGATKAFKAGELELGPDIDAQLALRPPTLGSGKPPTAEERTAAINEAVAAAIQRGIEQDQQPGMVTRVAQAAGRVATETGKQFMGAFQGDFTFDFSKMVRPGAGGLERTAAAASATVGVAAEGVLRTAEGVFSATVKGVVGQTLREFGVGEQDIREVDRLVTAAVITGAATGFGLVPRQPRAGVRKPDTLVRAGDEVITEREVQARAALFLDGEVPARRRAAVASRAVAKIRDPAARAIARQRIEGKIAEAQAQLVRDASAGGVLEGELLGLAPDLFAKRISPEVEGAVLQAVKDFLSRQDIPPIPPNAVGRQNVMQVVSDILKSGGKNARTAELVAIMERNGVTMDKLADIFTQSVSESARELNIMSQFSRQTGMTMRRGRAKGATAAEKKAGAETEDLFREMSKSRQINNSMMVRGALARVENTFRLALLGQMVTGVRNFLDAGNRIGVDVMTRALDRTEQKFAMAMGRTITEDVQVGPVAPLGEAMRILLRGKTQREVDAMFDSIAPFVQMRTLPDVNARTFAQLSADVIAGEIRLDTVGPLERFFGRGEQVMLYANFFNRLQERVVRNAVFATDMDRMLRKQGLTWERMVDERLIPDGLDQMLIHASDKALQLTFAQRPRLGTGRNLEGVFRSYGDFIRQMPLASFLEPFPGFLFNATRFISEFTPTGGLRLMREKNRLAVASGDFNALSREIVGTSIFAVALAMRSGNFPGLVPGPQSSEFIDQDGNIVDTKAFFVFQPFLFMADLVLRVQDGRVGDLTISDVRRGLLGAAPQFGFANETMTEAIDIMLGLDPTELSPDMLGRLFGQTVGGFMRPLSQLNDFASEYLGALNAQRETRTSTSPLGEIMNALPGGPLVLPERESPFRAGPPRSPRIDLDIPGTGVSFGTISGNLLKQITGLTFKDPRAIAENELLHLGFKFRDLTPKTGNRQADAVIDVFSGPLMEVFGGLLFASPGYRAASVPERRFMARHLINGVRAEGRKLAKLRAPALMERIKIERIPTDTARFLDTIARGATGGLGSFERIITRTDEEVTKELEKLGLRGIEFGDIKRGVMEMGRETTGAILRRVFPPGGVEPRDTRGGALRTGGTLRG